MIFKCVCCDKVQELIKEWISQVGHNKYSELFQKIADVYSINIEQFPNISEEGWDIFTKQMYDKKCSELIKLKWYINCWVEDENIKAKLFKRYEQVMNEVLYYTLVNLGDKALRNQDFETAAQLRDVRNNLFIGQTPEDMYTEFLKSNKEFITKLKDILEENRKVNWFSEVTKAKQAYNESKLIDSDYADSLLEDFQNVNNGRIV